MGDNGSETLSKIVTHLQAKEDIRSILYTYCRGADRGDAALMKSCYHPDAHDDHGFFVGNGWDFVDFVIPVLARLELCIHSLSNPLIEIEGDQAFVETQWSVIHRLRRGKKLSDIWDQGRYLDIFERRDGVWKISSRRVVLDTERWIETFNFLSLAPQNSHIVTAGQRGKNDPVYGLMTQQQSHRPAFQMADLWSHYKILLNIPKFILRLFARSL